MCRFDRAHALARLLRFGREQLVRRDEALVEPRALLAHVRPDPIERPREHLLGFPRGHQSPERPRDLEPKIGAGRREILARRVALGARRALERIEPSAAVDEPLQIQPRAVVVWDVGIHNLSQLTRLHDHELLDVIGPGIPGLRRQCRAPVRRASIGGRLRRLEPSLQLRDSEAVRKTLRNRLVERHDRRRLLCVRERWPPDDGDQDHRGQQSGRGQPHHGQPAPDNTDNTEGRCERGSCLDVMRVPERRATVCRSRPFLQ